MRAVFATVTALDVPPAPLLPPKLMLAEPPREIAPPKLPPPLPPLPARDCATIPADISPNVWITAALITETVFAEPPLAPEPPSDTLPDAKEDTLPLAAKPPLPPEPPID